MSPDNVDSFILDLHGFLIEALGLDLDEDKDYDILRDFVSSYLEKFVTRDRNYN